MMSKYTLADLMDTDVLPDDCNSEAEMYAAEFRDAGLMVAMRYMREKRMTNGYGEITHLGANGSPLAIFAFQAGICKHASPVVWIDQKNVVKGSKKFY